MSNEVGSGLASLGFWIFLSVVWYCDYSLYAAGHEPFFFTHITKTEEAANCD